MQNAIETASIVLLKKMFLKISQNSQETVLKVTTLAHVLSCEFCKISKSTFFTEHLQVTAFGAMTHCEINFSLLALPHHSSNSKHY